MRPLPRYASVGNAVAALAAVVRDRLGRPANVDLALSALTVGGGLRPDAGMVIFAVARTSGWLAHIADEYRQPPLRLRPQARYTGTDASGAAVRRA
jgi:citrate synthase